MEVAARGAQVMSFDRRQATHVFQQRHDDTLQTLCRLGAVTRSPYPPSGLMGVCSGAVLSPVVVTAVAMTTFLQRQSVATGLSLARSRGRIKGKPCMSPPLIVIVEDDQAIRDLVSSFLQDEGYRIRTCSTTADAVACVTRELPSLVILDLWMETRASGWDVCAALASDPATATIPIIICTGVSPALREQPEQLHPHYLVFVDKPFNLADLLSAVDDALVT